MPCHYRSISTQALNNIGSNMSWLGKALQSDGLICLPTLALISNMHFLTMGGFQRYQPSPKRRLIHDMSTHIEEMLIYKQKTTINISRVLGWSGSIRVTIKTEILSFYIEYAFFHLQIILSVPNHFHQLTIVYQTWKRLYFLQLLGTLPQDSVI